MKKLIYFAAAALMACACYGEVNPDTVHKGEPGPGPGSNSGAAGGAEVAVAVLSYPEDGTAVAAETVEAGISFGWEAVRYTGESLLVYTLMVDKAGADFSSPLLVVDSLRTTTYSLGKADLVALYKASKATAAADLRWTVTAKAGDQSQTAETRALRISYKRADPVVTTFTAPAAGASSNLVVADGETFSWEAPYWDGDAALTYELLFDKADGDFSSPIKVIESEGTSVTLTKEQLIEIHTAAAAEGESKSSVIWTVRTVTHEGDNASYLAPESRAYGFAYIVATFEPGDPLYVFGTGTEGEDGMQVAYTFSEPNNPKSFWPIEDPQTPVSGYPHVNKWYKEIAGFSGIAGENNKTLALTHFDYEVFVKVAKGSKVYFSTNRNNPDEGVMYSVSRDCKTYSAITSPAMATVPEMVDTASTDIFRIRLNTEDGSVVMYPVYNVYIRHTNYVNDAERNKALNYVGRGHWTLENYQINFESASGTAAGGELAYKFMFDLLKSSSHQPYGRINSKGSDEPTNMNGVTRLTEASKTETPERWYVQPVNTGGLVMVWSWPDFVVDDDLVTVDLYMNVEYAEKYTHRITK